MEIEFTVADLALQPTTYLGDAPTFRGWDILDRDKGIVLAIFHRDSEGYNLEFIGMRPFQYHNQELFIKFAGICARLLDIQLEVAELEQQYE